jgi:type I restriction enzyme, S subunit
MNSVSSNNTENSSDVIDYCKKSLDNIPESWKIIRLKHLTNESFVYGANEAALEDNPSYPRFIRITDIQENGSLSAKTFKSLSPELAKPYLLNNGDILLARSGTIGRAFVYREKWGAACFAGYLIRFRCNLKLIIPEFLFFYTQSKIYWLQIYSGAIQSTIQNFSAEKYKDISIPVPSKSEQYNLVKYLDRETTEIDALIAEKEQMLTLLDEKREAFISHAVTRGLDPNAPMKHSGLGWIGDIPQHWRVGQLKRTWKSDDYGISENIRGEGEIKVLRMTCIDDGVVDLTKGGEVESVDPYLFIEKGDLLFNRTNSLDQVAKVGIVQETPEKPTSFASYLVRIRTNDLVYPEFLVAYLNSQEFLTFARKNAIPAISQANLSPSRYGEMKIAFPAKSEQKEIVDEIEKERNQTKELINALINSIILLKERRSALITAAVTGQIKMEYMVI